MQLEQFILPVGDSGEALQACNAFLRSVKVLKVNREFVTDGPGSYWAILVEYLDAPSRSGGNKRARIDYREVLSPEDFAVFDKLRKFRKTLAEQDSVPAYAVFTNEQLAKIVTERVKTEKELAAIEGVGENKVSKYGAILSVVRAENHG